MHNIYGAEGAGGGGASRAAPRARRGVSSDVAGAAAGSRRGRRGRAGGRAGAGAGTGDGAGGGTGNVPLKGYSRRPLRWCTVSDGNVACWRYGTREDIEMFAVCSDLWR